MDYCPFKKHYKSEFVHLGRNASKEFIFDLSKQKQLASETTTNIS
jgi:hypothetical protein